MFTNMCLDLCVPKRCLPDGARKVCRVGRYNST